MSTSPDAATLHRYRRKLRRMNWYPPYWGAGIRIHSVNANFTRIETEMRLTWLNRNLFGTHFGGSLYAMCDPFFVFILFVHLGKEFIIWDQAASIRFVKPGKGRVRAVFEVPLEQIAAIRQEMQSVRKKTFLFQCQVLDQEGDVVAELTKEVYVRQKK